jgi:DNA-binding SARP family transcriptional activator
LSVRSGQRVIAGGDWGSARARRLFEYFLVREFRWAAREEIVEALWPEADPARAENNLRQSIHLLRRALQPGTEGDAARHYVRAHEGAYRLDPGEGHSYDVAEFQEAVREGLALLDRRRAEPAEGKLRAALELYRGSFLAESPYEDFAAAERETLRERFLTTIARLLAFYAAARRWEECGSLARRGLAEDCFHEDFHWHLAQAQLRLGNRREALAACHSYEKMMTHELDLPPSMRMRLLAEEAASLSGRRD